MMDRPIIMKQDELESIDLKNWVTKSNELIESTYKLTLQEQRILLVLASKVQVHDDILKSYRFRAKDFIEIIGNKTGTGFYSYLKETVLGLQKKVLTIRKDGKERNLNWVITSEYEDKEGYIILQFHPSLKDFFLELKEKFTSYQLENVVRLNSVYSIRFYELLKQYEKLKKRKFSIQDLKSILGIEQTKYKQYGHFKDKVIKVAQNEISEKTDISFSFEEIKKGRKVVEILFHIENKHKPVDAVLLDQGKGDIDSPEKELRYRLKQLEVHQDKINYLLQNVDVKQIERNVAYCEQRTNTVTSIGGFTYKAITLDYALSQSTAATNNQGAGLDENEDLLFYLSSYWRKSKEKPPFWFVDEESINEIQKLRKLDPEQAKQRYERIKSELYKAL
ncbi:replication initiation protein, partial [Bacillus dakarensis]|uniref:replication initiation protein n=1 Tax=Robertmurraya dakarensis TaxID=1926278 RepID=UPI001F45502B